jgi:hypothetical protein
MYTPACLKHMHAEAVAAVGGSRAPLLLLAAAIGRHMRCSRLPLTLAGLGERHVADVPAGITCTLHTVLSMLP